MVNRAKALSPTQVQLDLLEIRNRALLAKESIENWRKNGMGGTNLVPVGILPIESKLDLIVREIESCLRIFSYLERSKQLLPLSDD